MYYALRSLIPRVYLANREKIKVRPSIENDNKRLFIVRFDRTFCRRLIAVRNPKARYQSKSIRNPFNGSLLIEKNREKTTFFRELYKSNTNRDRAITVRY